MLLGTFIPVVRLSQDYVLAVHLFIIDIIFCAVKLCVAGVNGEGVGETKLRGIRVAASLKVKTASSASLRPPETRLSAN